MTYFVYLLRCRDGTFYTGITNDLKKRLKEHNEGKAGARYTRGRRPVELIYSEPANNRSSAQKREYEIRKLSHAEKEKFTSKSKKILEGN